MHKRPKYLSRRWGGAVLMASVILVVGCTSKVDMKQAEGHSKLGLAFLASQQIQPAFIEFQKALELNPKNPDVHYALGHIYYLQEKFPEAEREFKRVLKLNDEDAKSWNYLGKVYAEQGQLDLALQQYDRALAIVQYPTPDFAHYNKGLVYVKKGQTDQAIRAFRTALQVNPSDPYDRAAYELGRLYLAQGARKEAVDVLQVAVRRSPQFTEAHWYLAEAYAKNGMRSQALESYQKVIDLAPGSGWADEAKIHVKQLTRELKER